MSGRGWKKGVPRGPLSEATKAKIAESHRRRWQDPKIRHIITESVQKSYRDGKLARYKIQWDSDMDRLLINIYKKYKFSEFRQIAPQKIGVGENAVCQRFRYLRTIGRIPPYVKPERAPSSKPQKHSKKTVLSINPTLKNAQLTADAYARSLLQTV